MWQILAAKSSNKGVGAFAACPVSRIEIIKSDIIRRLPSSFDGNSSPYVFAWGEDRTVWAIRSGCSTFYNCSETPGTEIQQDYENDLFKVGRFASHIARKRSHTRLLELKMAVLFRRFKLNL